MASPDWMRSNLESELWKIEGLKRLRVRLHRVCDGIFFFRGKRVGGLPTANRFGVNFNVGPRVQAAQHKTICVIIKHGNRETLIAAFVPERIEPHHTRVLDLKWVSLFQRTQPVCMAMQARIDAIYTPQIVQQDRFKISAGAPAHHRAIIAHEIAIAVFQVGHPSEQRKDKKCEQDNCNYFHGEHFSAIANSGQPHSGSMA
jgi:hypothetical protein